MEFLRSLRRVFERVAPSLATGLPVAGLVLMAVAAAFALRSWDFARTRVRATATVTENVSRFAKGGGVEYLPRFRFRLPSGELIAVQAQSGSDEIEFAAGETVPVLYPAGNPQGAVIATTWRAYRGAIVWGVLGVIVFDVGWALRGVVRARAAALNVGGG